VGEFCFMPIKVARERNGLSAPPGRVTKSVPDPLTVRMMVTGIRESAHFAHPAPIKMPSCQNFLSHGVDRLPQAALACDRKEQDLGRDDA
jgi:hypothetical protein